MKITTIRNIFFLLLTTLSCLIFVNTPMTGEEDESRLELMLCRIEKQDEVKSEEALIPSLCLKNLLRENLI